MIELEKLPENLEESFSTELKIVRAFYFKNER